MDTAALDDRARAILQSNDRGAYTVPTSRLYPHQWNWDSAFAALGFATFDVDRAWTEIETLFEAQWPNGMVPHIVYRHEESDYFPGPKAWGVHRNPPTSGHSQPPVAATIALDIYRRDPPAGRARLGALFPKLCAWHRWFHAARNAGDGLTAVVHPWESGRDNSPDWDEAMRNVETSGVSPYERRDTSHVDASMRPTRLDYDRYMSIVEFGRRHGWDDEAMRERSPFFVVDPCLTFILMRADRDLAEIAKLLGDGDAARDFEGLADKAAAGVASLWMAGARAYSARDVRTGTASGARCVGTFLCFYGGVDEPAVAARLEETIGSVRYGLPVSDPNDGAFDPMRYWRGPVWPIANYMAARGLAECGRGAMATRLRNDIAQLIARRGFREYFSPLDGSPAGGDDFTWTAAVWLHWASPSAGRAA